MALGQKRNRSLIPQASSALEQFKYEVANELGIDQSWKTGYWGDIPARQCGAVGGHMVRRMIAAAEQSLIQQATASVQSGFRQSVGGLGGSFPLEPDVSAQGTSSAHNPNELKGGGY
ncbi:MAG: small, acid-soluble spore protein, alpha/beta type [Limnochordia bacterium]|jgi:small acid-soluble spore protein A (major alpha-type SASP)|nr:alpha/beta-type small acid-soluble spore protein [Bacillota bacterium]